MTSITIWYKWLAMHNFPNQEPSVVTDLKNNNNWNCICCINLIKLDLRLFCFQAQFKSVQASSLFCIVSLFVLLNDMCGHLESLQSLRHIIIYLKFHFIWSVTFCWILAECLQLWCDLLAHFILKKSLCMHYPFVETEFVTAA